MFSTIAAVSRQISDRYAQTLADHLLVEYRMSCFTAGRVLNWISCACMILMPFLTVKGGMMFLFLAAINLALWERLLPPLEKKHWKAEKPFREYWYFDDFMMILLYMIVIFNVSLGAVLFFDLVGSVFRVSIVKDRVDHMLTIVSVSSQSVMFYLVTVEARVPPHATDIEKVYAMESAQ